MNRKVSAEVVSMRFHAADVGPKFLGKQDYAPAMAI